MDMFLNNIYLINWLKDNMRDKMHIIYPIVKIKYSFVLIVKLRFVEIR